MAQRFSHKSVRVNIYSCPLVKWGRVANTERERRKEVRVLAFIKYSVISSTILTESTFYEILFLTIFFFKYGYSPAHACMLNMKLETSDG